MMKKIGFIIILIAAFGFRIPSTQEDEVELVCVKKHIATNTCHYNFKINGIKYRYVDNKCKGKKEDILEKAKAGKLGLAKEWKIECPEKKDGH